MNVSNGAASARAGSANVELRLRGKRLLLCAVPTPVTPHWNARLEYWADGQRTAFHNQGARA
ncbi:hypothetical protein [Sphingomonas sp. GC_Shp_3]|uniref:hypothetical protein n=1 Tax=Sphingomonas sp. GC_Shp_3 TaxID=2937383 RepID=UPI00226A7BE5|nr:hypothetical protein [Sphingomonas sp. GC_Shp_3]